MEDQNKDHLKILAFTNNTASTHWRFEGIAERINKETEHEMAVYPYLSWNENIVGANLVVLEQLTNPAIVDFCHQNGAKVVFESDDAMIDTYGRERKNLQHLGPAFRGKSIETIRKCDALTVTNQRLADNYARFTKAPIYVLPNYMDYGWYGKQELRLQRTTDEIRLGWFGSQGHFEDLRWLLPVLQKILAKYKNVRFIYCGYGGFSSNKESTEVGWGEDVFKELPRSQREFVLAVKPWFWPIKHKTLDIDIGIAPLIDDYFNWCKTNIKWQEYAALRTPAVVSKVLYGEDVKHGKDGFVAETAEDWEKYLSMLIEDAKLRRDMGKEAQRRINKDFNLDKHWTKWVDVYNKIVFG